MSTRAKEPEVEDDKEWTALESAVINAEQEWVFRILGKRSTVPQEDRYKFWTEMMRQAKALPKFIREEALRDGIDADAHQNKDGDWIGKSRVYDRRTRSRVEHPVVAAQERLAAERARDADISARRSKLKVVKKDEA